jgi:hypothetical protein
MFFAAGIMEILIDISSNTFQSKEYLRRAITARNSKSSKIQT